MEMTNEWTQIILVTIWAALLATFAYTCYRLATWYMVWVKYPSEILPHTTGPIGDASVTAMIGYDDDEMAKVRELLAETVGHCCNDCGVYLSDAQLDWIGNAAHCRA
jgi:hypothetical protein